MVTALD